MTAIKNPSTGPQTVKVSYKGTPGVTVYYAAYDLSGNVVTARTPVGVSESLIVAGLYTYDQSVSLDEFIAEWDEADGQPPAVEIVSTRHALQLPSAPTSLTATGGDTTATVTFIPGSSGGSTILSYTLTAIDATNSGRGGQTITRTLAGAVTFTGLTNGDVYHFTAHQTTSQGTSPESSQSNAVTPNPPASTVPGVPRNVVANQTGSGTVTVTFDAPLSNGGSAITSYVTSVVDQTNSAHNTTQTGNSPATISSLFTAETYHFTVHAVNAVGAGAESTASNTVTITASGSPAAFVHSFATNSKLIVDATGSGGTLAWTVDGVVQAQTAAIVAYGPLTVGTHHVKLTATSGGTPTTSERDIDVPWIGEPITAQGDVFNGNPGHPTSPLGSGLPKLSILPPIGPWGTTEQLNETELYPVSGADPAQDNVARVVHNSDWTTTIIARSVEYLYITGPSNEPFGNKYRPNFKQKTSPDAQLDNKQNGRAANAYLAVKDPVVSGQLTLATDTPTLRFYRYELMFLGTNWDGSHPPGYPSQLLYLNNACETDGSLFLITATTNIQVTTKDQKAGTTAKWDTHSMQYDAWQNYVIEVKMSPDPAIGYIRVYRDGVVVTNKPSGVDGSGRLFMSTAALDGTGKPTSFVGPNVCVYRNYAPITTIYQGGGTVPDMSVKFRNMRVGPTFDSVFTSNIIPLPTITSISPTTAARGATLDVTITGTGYANYLPGVTVAISGPGLYGATSTGVTINSVTYTDTTSITVNITVASSAPTGLRSITVTNPSGGVVGLPLLTVT